jgi:hypothetical protein
MSNEIHDLVGDLVLFFLYVFGDMISGFFIHA